MIDALSALMPPLADHREVDDFLDVVLGDTDLLAAEFEAIIANAWGGSAEAAPAQVRRDAGGGLSPPPASHLPAEHVLGPTRPPQARVRSPPT